jgi:hypothetical protein
MIGICDSTFILSLAKGKGKGFDIVFFIHIIPFREKCVRMFISLDFHYLVLILK